jgi:hypothetical protein
MPFLAVLGTETEVMGWGTRLADVARHLPPQGRMEVIDGVGHFSISRRRTPWPT